jgi:hypothetical protein
MTRATRADRGQRAQCRNLLRHRMFQAEALETSSAGTAVVSLPRPASAQRARQSAQRAVESGAASVTSSRVLGAKRRGSGYLSRHPRQGASQRRRDQAVVRT